MFLKNFSCDFCLFLHFVMKHSFNNILILWIVFTNQISITFSLCNQKCCSKNHNGEDDDQELIFEIFCNKIIWDCCDDDDDDDRTTTTTTTYLVGFKSENIFTILELLFVKHDIIDCIIFDLKNFDRQIQANDYLEQNSHKKQYSLHEIDFNLMLLVTEFCSKMAIKQQQRQKRQLIKWNLISPGTNWCGPNNKARNYSDLGQAKLIDICCREHDHCPIIIESKMTKYNNIYNNDFFTLLLCQCDEFFYECLNQLPSLYSFYEYLIRNLYFKRPLMKCIETIDCVAEWQMYRPIVVVSANKQWIWKLDNFEQLFNKPCRKEFRLITFDEYQYKKKLSSIIIIDGGNQVKPVHDNKMKPGNNNGSRETTTTRENNHHDHNQDKNQSNSKCLCVYIWIFFSILQIFFIH